MLTDRTPRLSGHARHRLCQRCISEADVQYILRHGERVRDVGDGASEVSIAREQRAELGSTDMNRLERLKRIVVVIAEDGTIVTAMKEAHFTRRSRGHRRLSCRDRAIRADRRKRGRLHAQRSRP